MGRHGAENIGKRSQDDRGGRLRRSPTRQRSRSPSPNAGGWSRDDRGSRHWRSPLRQRSRSPSPNAGPAGNTICSICSKAFSSAKIRDLHLPICRKKQQAAMSSSSGTGEWETKYDQNTGYFYYTNAVTGETRWGEAANVHPHSVALLEATGAQLAQQAALLQATFNPNAAAARAPMAALPHSAPLLTAQTAAVASSTVAALAGERGPGEHQQYGFPLHEAHAWQTLAPMPAPVAPYPAPPAALPTALPARGAADSASAWQEESGTTAQLASWASETYEPEGGAVTDILRSDEPEYGTSDRRPVVGRVAQGGAAGTGSGRASGSGGRSGGCRRPAADAAAATQLANSTESGRRDGLRGERRSDAWQSGERRREDRHSESHGRERSLRREPSEQRKQVRSPMRSHSRDGKRRDWREGRNADSLRRGRSGTRDRSPQPARRPKRSRSRSKNRSSKRDHSPRRSRSRSRNRSSKRDHSPRRSRSRSRNRSSKRDHSPRRSRSRSRNRSSKRDHSPRRSRSRSRNRSSKRDHSPRRSRSRSRNRSSKRDHSPRRSRSRSKNRSSKRDHSPGRSRSHSRKRSPRRGRSRSREPPRAWEEPRAKRDGRLRGQDCDRRDAPFTRPAHLLTMTDHAPDLGAGHSTAIARVPPCRASGDNGTRGGVFQEPRGGPRYGQVDSKIADSASAPAIGSDWTVGHKPGRGDHPGERPRNRHAGDGDSAQSITSATPRLQGAAASEPADAEMLSQNDTPAPCIAYGARPASHDDWMCHNCSAMVFASKIACFKCSAPRVPASSAIFDRGVDLRSKLQATSGDASTSEVRSAVDLRAKLLGTERKDRQGRGQSRRKRGSSVTPSSKQPQGGPALPAVHTLECGDLRSRLKQKRNGTAA